MDYKRFLELVERFFDRAGTVLHKKGEDYGFSGDAPSFILIDENRNAYYLLEMALPPDLPRADQHLQRAITAYAANNQLNADAVKALSILGEDIRTVKGNPVDDDAIHIKSLQQKYALVAAADVVDDLDKFLNDLEIEHQTVPLKGIFTIYFFNTDTADALERFYETVANTDVPEESAAPVAPIVEKEPEEAITPLEEMDGEEEIEHLDDAIEHEAAEEIDEKALEIEEIAPEPETIPEIVPEPAPEPISEVGAGISIDSPPPIVDLRPRPEGEGWERGIEQGEGVQRTGEGETRPNEVEPEPADVEEDITIDSPPPVGEGVRRTGEGEIAQPEEVAAIEPEPVVEPVAEAEPELIADTITPLIDDVEAQLAHSEEIVPTEEVVEIKPVPANVGADISIVSPPPLGEGVRRTGEGATRPDEPEPEPTPEPVAEAAIAQEPESVSEVGAGSARPNEPEPIIEPVATIAPVAAAVAPAIEARSSRVPTLIHDLLLYTPSALLRLITRERIPHAITYWLAGMLVLFGLYAIPVEFFTESIVDTIFAKETDTLADIQGFFAQNIFNQPLGALLSSVANGAIGLFAFDLSLMKFIFSHYFLQYILAAAYLLAIFPFWRRFALAVIRICVIFAIFYIPAILAEGSGVRAIMTNADMALVHAEGGQLLMTITAAAGGILAIGIAIPVVLLILAISTKLK